MWDGGHRVTTTLGEGGREGGGNGPGVDRAQRERQGFGPAALPASQQGLVFTPLSSLLASYPRWWSGG